MGPFSSKYLTKILKLSFSSKTFRTVNLFLIFEQKRGSATYTSSIQYN